MQNETPTTATDKLVTDDTIQGDTGGDEATTDTSSSGEGEATGAEPADEGDEDGNE